MQSFLGDREADGFQVMCTYVPQCKRYMWKLLGRKHIKKIRQNLFKGEKESAMPFSVTKTKTKEES